MTTFHFTTVWGVLIIHKWRWIDELVLPEFQSSFRFCDYPKLTFRVRSAEIKESSVVRGFTQWVYYFGCSRICDENLLLRMYSSISLFGREDKNSLWTGFDDIGRASSKPSSQRLVNHRLKEADLRPNGNRDRFPHGNSKDRLQSLK